MKAIHVEHALSLDLILHSKFVGSRNFAAVSWALTVITAVSWALHRELGGHMQRRDGLDWLVS